MIKNVIILGNHIQGLGIARICGKLGLNVILFNTDILCVTRFSKYCKYFVKFNNTNDLLLKLLDAQYASKETIIMPTNDKLVKFLSDNYDKLLVKYCLSIPEPVVTNICYNKIQTYKKAEELGIPIPNSYFPENLSQVTKLSVEIEYPVIIKPAIMHTFVKKTKQKAFKCINKEELLKSYKLTISMIPANEVIIQELLPGGAKQLFSFASFCSSNKIWGSFIVNRIRQKPMDFGKSTTFAKTVINETIDSYSRKFLLGINYWGVSELEFMYDENSDDYKLIEINPRTWKWHNISNLIGINLIQQMIDFIDGKKIDELKNEKEGLAWQERITDFFVIFQEIVKGNLNIRSTYKTMKIPIQYACWDKKDPIPALFYLLFLPYLLFKRS